MLPIEKTYLSVMNIFKKRGFFGEGTIEITNKKMAD